MTNNEILESIDNITEQQNTSMFDVCSAISNFYDKQLTVMEYSNYNNSSFNDVGIFMESEQKDGTGNTSIIKKIWNAIKHVFVMLTTHIRMMIDKIKLFFNKNDGKHSNYISCDSIVLRILSNSRANVPDDTSKWKIPAVNPKYIAEQNKKYSTDAEIDKYNKKHKNDTQVYSEAATDNRYVTINIPTGAGSTMYPKTVRVPRNDIITEINKDEKTISFHIKGKGKLQRIKMTNEDSSTSKGEIEGLKKSWTHSAHIALYLMSKPDKFDKLVALTDLAVEILFMKKKSHIHLFDKKCKSILSDLNKNAKHTDLTKVKLSIKDLTEFQKKINNLNYKIDKFADINCDVSSFDKDTIDNFNRLSRSLLDIQIAMNSLTSSLENNIIVSDCFVGCIKNMALLDQFVSTCIQEGMAPKYIAYNTWLVSDPCIRGNNDTYKPIWGQTRFIFFPPDNRFVYKIAMSGLGVTSNRAEIRTSEMFEKMDRVDLIAPVVKTWDTESILAMERIMSVSDVSLPECAMYTKSANDAIVEYEKKNNVKLNIKIADQHKDNVKFDTKNKCYRSIDYGIASRSYKKK